MNCITDFLPDDTSEHNADGESIEEVVFGIQPAPTLTPSELDATVYGGNPSAATVAGFALDEINRLERDNARLRAALETIATSNKYATVDTPIEEIVSTLQQWVSYLREVAHKSLEAK